jgi:hypothetical protein
VWWGEVQIMYTHVSECKTAKMMPVETVPGIGKGG